MTDHDRKLIAHQALADRIDLMGGHPRAGDTYTHWKGGLYNVVMVGIDEDTLAQRVGYFSQTHQTYSFRTLDDWLALGRP
jgi:hypothetical protein